MCGTVNHPCLSKHLQADTAPGGGGGDNPRYGLYRYVSRDRVGFLRFPAVSIVYPARS